MTPKEKAEELFNRFNKEGLQEIINLVDRHKRKEIIKQCALICVDEIKESLKNQIHQVDMLDVIYFEEVKKEIQKL